MYSVGALVSAALVGTGLSVLGAAVRGEVDQGTRAALLAAAAAILGLSDLGIGGLRTPSLRRQTSPVWLRRYSEPKTYLFWGLDLGLGFSTIRVTSLFWLAAVAIVLWVPLPVAPAVAALYGAALATVFAIALIRRRDDDARAASLLSRERMNALRRRYCNAAVWSGVFDLRGPHHVPLVGWPKTAWRSGSGARRTEPGGSAETA